MKKCEFCKEEIGDDSIKCKYCGEDLAKKDKLLRKSKYLLIVSLICFGLSFLTNAIDEETAGLIFLVFIVCMFMAVIFFFKGILYHPEKELLKRKEKELQYNLKHKVEEIKCICNECGKVWHFLKSEFEGFASDALCFSCAGCASCSPLALFTAGYAQEQNRRAESLMKCPDCKSSNITKETIFHEKKN